MTATPGGGFALLLVTQHQAAAGAFAFVLSRRASDFGSHAAHQRGDILHAVKDAQVRVVAQFLAAVVRFRDLVLPKPRPRS